MKIISFFNSDYNFSATLAKICDLESDELIFISDVNSLKTYNFSKHDIVIIDVDDYRDSIDNIALLIKAYGNYINHYNIQNKLPFSNYVTIWL